MTSAEAPSPDDFAQWRAHPITEMMMAAMEKAADAQKETWVAGVWSNDYASPEERERALIAMNRAKVRAETYREVVGFTLPDLIAVLELTPAPDERQPVPGVYE